MSVLMVLVCVLGQRVPVFSSFPSAEILNKTENTTEVYAQAATPEERITEGVYLNQEAYEFFLRGETKGAIERYEKALAIFREFQAKGGEGNSLNGLGEVYLATKQPDKALEYFQQALGVFQAVGRLPEGDRAYEGYTLQFIASAYEQKREYDRAIQPLNQALEIFQGLLQTTQGNQDSLLISQKLTLNQLGTISFKSGKYPQALDFFQKSLGVMQSQRDRIGEAQTYNNIGVVYANLSQYQKALESYQKALEIVRDLCCYKGDEASILNNLSSLYYSLNQPAQALDYAQQSAKIYENLKGRNYEGLERSQIELLQDTLGSVSLNATWLNQRLSVRPTIADTNQSVYLVKMGEAIHLNNLGQIYVQQNTPERSISLFNQALAIYREIPNPLGEAITLNLLGQTNYQLGNVEAALSFNQQALAIYQKEGDKAGIGIALSNSGEIYAKEGKYGQAEEALSRAIQLQQEVGDKASEGFARRNLGWVQLEQGKLADSITNLQATVEIIESLRPGLSDASKVSIFETQSVAYRLLQKALISQNKIESALEVSERGRARAFVELLATKQTGKSQITPITISQIKELARQEKSTLVEYSLISTPLQDTDLYIWVISPTRKIDFRQVNLSKFATEAQIKNFKFLTTWVLESRQAVLDRRRRIEGKHQLKNLHQLLIQPIDELLPKDAKSGVVLVPQGALFLLPFPALMDQQENYLISQHPLTIAPSIQVLELTRKQRQNLATSAGEKVIVGNPVMPSLTPELGGKPIVLAPLPGSEIEAKEIGGLLKTAVLSGNQATETTVVERMKKAQVIHLATHGLLDEFKHLDWGMPGAIALAPDQKSDGFLTSEEIMGLDLKASLVVLSACNTGKGRLTSDGVIGLSRAWMAAGVPSLVVSLWSVPDQPTASLMTQFYEEQQQPINRAQALQQAMLTVMKQYSHPLDWSGFILMGEGA